MKQASYVKQPGTVIEVNDEMLFGRIKVNAPGICQSIKTDYLPWIYPKNQNSSGQFRKMKKGEKVWVYQNPDNPGELWYEPLNEMTELAKQIITTSPDDVEIIMARDVSGFAALIYATSEDGMNIYFGGSSLLMLPDLVELKNDNECQLYMDKDVFLGKPTSSKFGACVTPLLLALLTRIGHLMSSLATKAATSVYTSSLSQHFTKISQEIESLNSSLESQDVFLT